MSVLEPPEPEEEPNTPTTDPLRDAVDWDSLDFEEPEGITPVSALTTPDLLDRYNKVNRDLQARGEVLHQTTGEARELHSLRSSYVLELRKRGLL